MASNKSHELTQSLLKMSATLPLSVIGQASNTICDTVASSLSVYFKLKYRRILYLSVYKL